MDLVKGVAVDLVKEVAVDQVKGAVGSLISKLYKLLNEEYKLQKGVAEKIGSLIKELECAHAALRKVAGLPPDQLEEQVKIWAREVREASYDMEDVVDTFLVSAQGDPAEQTDHQSLLEVLKNKMADVYSMLVSGPLKRRKIEVTVDDINKRLQEVTERHRRYRAEDIVAKPAAKSTVDPRLAAMYTEVTQLVGIKKPSAQLISMLSLAQEGDETSNKKMKIVSVVGTGGLGKTTLAKTVYDKVKVHFQCRAFVPVGRDPDLKKVFRDVLIELDKGKYMDSKYEKLDERQLINELREYLGRKRYFIVIDDIWEIKSWQTIKLALVQDKCGISRVITTTRKLEVARECGEVYKLEPLSFDKSEKLFYTRIFGSEGKFSDTQLDEASDKMLKKCDGVPLAIITVASLLVGKSREEWIEVCHTIFFRDKNKNHQQVSDTEWILSLSYYDLPAHLKTCLLYLSAFPEDFVIAKGPLIRKWVAEGFVHNKEPGTSLFEVGEEYFYELINRSMIQAVELEWWDDMVFDDMVIGCRLHDMVLDLLRVRSREENFITISRNTSISEGTSSPSNRVRRLVHQNKTEEQTHRESLLGMDLQHVRTFISCNSGTITASKVQSFGLLRVLHLEDCREVNVEHVVKLLHLRYLGITGTQIIGEFPEGIGALKFLQTLDFDWGQEKVLPSSMGLLTQLTRLRPGYCNPPSGVIEKLTSLEDLEIFCHGIARPFAKELSKLRELRVLKCFFANNYKGFHSDLVESLGNLHKIRRLELDINLSGEALEQVQAIWDAVVLPRPLQRLFMDVLGFCALPSRINPSDLPNLTYLELRMSRLGEQGLKILATLPELRHLKLKAFDTVTITVNDGFFCKLTSLVLTCSTVLFVLNEDSSISFTIWNHDLVDIAAFGSQTGTVRAPAVMPNLQMLCFYVNVDGLVCYNGSCDKLGLEYHLPSLQKVRVNLDCEGALDEEVERQATALKHAIKAHPNRPTLQIAFDGEDEDDSSTDQEEDSSTDHEEGDSSPDQGEEDSSTDHEEGDSSPDQEEEE